MATKPTFSTPSNISLANQFRDLLLLMLRMKAWHVLYMVIPLLFAMSIVFLPALLNSITSMGGADADAKNEGDPLVMYNASDLVASGHRVLIDRSAFPAEISALNSIMADRGGNTNWIKDCASESACQAKFMSEDDDSIIGYIAYSRNPSKRANLDCRWATLSLQRCIYLYQLMALSMQSASGKETLFKDFKLFTLKIGRVEDPEFREKSILKAEIKLPKSECADWVNKGMFQVNMTFLLGITIVLATLGVVFYYLVSTLSCIQALKADGFFRLLVRNGLSPISYWIIIWLMTAVECALFAGMYVVTHTLNCPGVFPAADMGRVYLFMYFYYINIVGIMYLLEILISTLVVVSMMSITLVLAVGIISFITYTNIINKFSVVSYIFPVINVHNYTMAYMTRDILQKMLGEIHISKNASFYESRLVALLIAPVFLVLFIAFVDCLVSSGNGLCLPAYFLFSARFWSPGDLAERKDQEAPAVDSDKTEAHVEPVAGVSATIVVREVSKTYKSCCSSAGVNVLNGLSCKIYKDQITALIGHNGAGKSTLIKIMTGEESADSGSAHVADINVTDSLERLALRGRITVCPQFDALCGELSVYENIRVTLNCKGACNNTEVEKARTMLKRLGLGDKENVKSTDLSGGQKRKVNTILALLGDPQVVFLDEPTSGLDPVSRRQLWQLLQEEKLGRSIVLCTQFMDEADVLADRKIFLSGGQIVCAGSSMFLKRAFGCSFTLNVSLKSKSDAPKLLSKLKGVQLRSQFETELQLEVPAAKPEVLVGAVQTLESSQEIETFGLSQATLDDIFMKLSGVSSKEVIDAFRLGDLSKLIKKPDTSVSIKKDNSVALQKSLGQVPEMQPSVFKQFSALLWINMKRQLRTKSSIFSRFVMPSLLLALVGLSASSGSSNQKEIVKGGVKEKRIHESGARSAKTSIRLIDPIFDQLMEDEVWKISVTYIKDVGSEVTDLGEAWPFNDIPVANKSSKDVSLKSFLSQKSTYETIETSCKKNGCTVLYSSSWDKRQPNNQRTIAMGKVNSFSNKDDSIHDLRKIFVRVSKLFGAATFENSTSLSFVKPFSEYKAFQKELVLFLIAFCLFPVSYLTDPIEDKSSKVRSHLVSMGMSNLAYWINTFLLHWFQYILCFAISVSLICMSYKYANAYFILVCLPTLFLGTTSNQLVIYIVASVARNRSILIYCNFVALILPIIFIGVSLSSKTVILLIIWLLPPVAPIALIYFSMAFATYSLEYYNVDDVSQIPDLYNNCWSSAYIINSLIAMLVHICIMCCVLILIEGPGLRILCLRKSETSNSEKTTVSAMDQGAQKEVDRLLQSPRSPKNVLEVRDLCKTYPNGVCAVRGVTFGTIVGEIFGLLGANGAGKTTSMSVIVGEESPTSGDCEVRVKGGAWVSGQVGASTGAIGYCPQHNPLYDSVTVVEHMQLYAQIRGVPSAVAERQVAALIQGLGLQPHSEKFAGQLSGGNKRRLCLAIALLGDPVLVVIDEASTGVDPENKRFIWEAIRAMLHDQRSVMVTTHSMEEVEALCSRVGIMNRGRMISFGTVQQLRSQYGDAFTLDVLVRQNSDGKTAAQRKAAIKAAVSSQFKGAVPLEDLSLCMQFYIPKTSVSSLSTALQWLTANQNRLDIDYCSLYQMSLDQVFVKLVKQFDS